MNKTAIEKEARKVQFEIWSQREQLWPLRAPKIKAMFTPRVVAEYYGLDYQTRDRIDADGSKGVGFEAAGLLELHPDRGTIVISSRFSYPVQRFTVAHEIGHFFYTLILEEERVIGIDQ